MWSTADFRHEGLFYPAPPDRVKRSPYDAQFGPKVMGGGGGGGGGRGVLITSSLPQDVLENITSEEELEVVDSIEIVAHYQPSITAETTHQASSSAVQASISTSHEFICCVCSKATSGAHQCPPCGRHIYVKCCHRTSEEEGYGAPVLCLAMF